jgi:hypothetical protein
MRSSEGAGGGDVFAGVAAVHGGDVVAGVEADAVGVVEVLAGEAGQVVKLAVVGHIEGGLEVDGGEHLVPLALGREFVELHTERLHAVGAEDAMVAAGRTVGADGAA